MYKGEPLARRQFVGGVCLLFGIGLGGCGGSTGSTASAVATSTPTPTPTPTPAPTPTPTGGINFGSTGWNGPSYSSTATAPSINDFVSIPAASYTFHEANTSTGVAETVALSAYLISKYQVTNANWKAYCVANGVTSYPRYWTSDGRYPAGKENHPVLFISATALAAFADWLSTVISGYRFRLPSEGEWEYAALGTNTTYSFPWGASAGTSHSGGVLTTRYNYNGLCSAYLLNGSGIIMLSYFDDNVVTQLSNGTVLTNDTAPLSTVLSISSSGSVTGWQYDSSSNSNWADFAKSDQYEALVNIYGGYTTPVGTYPTGASWCGALDMAGNAYEWTSTDSVATNGAETGTTVRNVRGGSWYATGNSGRSTYRGEGRAPSGAYHSVGGRLAATRI